MEQWWNDTDMEKPQGSDQTPFQRLTINHK